MNRISLLYIGDATDGPVEEILRIRSLDHAIRLFGGYHYERTVVTSGATGYTLSVTPWANQVTPMQVDSDGLLIPRRLFEFHVNGSQLSWTRTGEASALVTFRVLTEPGSSSILKGILSARKAGADMHVIRVGGGAHATATAGNFMFMAQFPGTRYNGTTITVSGGSVIVRAAPGTGRDWTYTPANDRALTQSLRDDVARGWQTTFLFGPSHPTSLTVPSGTYTLAGGTNGQFTPTIFNDFCEDYDLLGVDVLCPVGLDSAQISGSFDLIGSFEYPTLIVAQTPVTGIAVTGLVQDQRFLVATPFKIRYDNGDPKERLDDAAPLVAAIISKSQFGLTLAELPELPAEPRYNQGELHALASSGYTVAYRSITKDWALWHVVTGDRNWPVSTYRAFQEVVRPLYETLEPTLGNQAVDMTLLERLVEEAFSQVQGSRILDWRLTLEGDTIYADVEFVPWGEIRAIQAKIVLGTPQSVSPV